MKVDIFNTDKKYKIIYADPPWMEQGGGRIKRGADRHYSLMKTEEIKALPISRLADEEGCHLYLWTTNKFLPDALEVVKAWGFEYITTITWAKDRMGLGQYFRGMSEHCIFASTKKRLPYKKELQMGGSVKRCQGVTAFYEAKTEHSKKPIKMIEMIEKVSYFPAIELFARDSRAGWDNWGAEAPEE